MDERAVRGHGGHPRPRQRRLRDLRLAPARGPPDITTMVIWLLLDALYVLLVVVISSSSSNSSSGNSSSSSSSSSNDLRLAPARGLLPPAGPRLGAEGRSYEEFTRLAETRQARNSLDYIITAETTLN